MSDRTTLIQPSFNGGELSSRLGGRVDQNVYTIACEEMIGWVPMVQGCAVAAPGTHYVETAAGPCRLMPFEYSITEGYVIEASDAKFRFYTNDARIETAPGVAYELAVPWTHDEILTLDFHQSADVLYLTGGGKKPQKLKRTAATTFAIEDLVLRNGPIGDANTDESITITADATTGAATITCTEQIFVPTDVGGLFEIEAVDFNDIPSWAPGLTINTGDKRTWDGKVYECGGTPGETDPRRTGNIGPTHDRGTEWDGGDGTDTSDKGPYGVIWTFLYTRHGLVRITGYVSPWQVTCEVLKRLTDSVVDTPTWRWAFGAFSDTRGHPDKVCLWNERLVLAKGNKGYASVVGDYENFERRDSSGNFQQDLAGTFTLPNPDAIQWIVPDKQLLLGTTKAEYAVDQTIRQSDAAGPPIFDVKRQCSNGSATAKPLQADKLLFIQRARRKLMELDYTIQADRYEAPDLSRLVDHIGKEKFRELAWQQEPERIVWAVLESGWLASLTYSPSQQVMGWARRELGGGMRAESICRITDPEGERDQIWISAEMGGARLILRMAKLWEQKDDPADAFLVDAGLSYDGPGSKTLSGLGHLNGRQVQILGDGKPHRELVVSNSEVTLDFYAARAHVGLGYQSRITMLRLEGGQDEGTAQGKLNRVVDLTLRLIESQGLQVTVQGMEPIPLETRLAPDQMDQAVPLYSGDFPIETGGLFDRRGEIVIERTQPTPATLIALMPAREVGEE